MKKIKVFYILSSGRSGSTILEMLLNCFSDSLTLGEFQLLLLEKNINAKCGCGEYISKDIFWKNVLNKIDDEKLFSKYRKTFKSKTGHYGKVIRIRSIINIIFDNFNNSQKNYADLNYKLFSCLSQENPAINVFIDSSKDLYRLYDLRFSRDIEIFPIHLYKSPLSYVYSMIKEYNGLKRFYYLIRFSFRWIIENFLMKIVMKKFKKGLSLNYENLCANYDIILSEVRSKINLEKEKIDDYNLNSHFNHGISGNISRNSSLIKLDKKYQNNLNLIEKNIIKSITFLLKLN